jgi:hypothetical protein
MRRRKSPFGFLLLFLSRKRPRRLARPSKLQQSSISVIARVDAIPAGAKGRVSVRSRLCRRNLCESAGPTESAAGASVGPRARARGRRAITRIVYAGAPRGYLIRRARGSNLSGGGRAGGRAEEEEEEEEAAKAAFAPPQSRLMRDTLRRNALLCRPILPVNAEFRVSSPNGKDRGTDEGIIPSRKGDRVAT